MEQPNSRIQFSKLRNFSEIAFDTRVFLKEHWRSFFFIIIMYAGPILLIQTYNSSAGIEQLLQELLQNPSETPTPKLTDTELIIYQLIALVASIIFNGISFSYIFVYSQNQELNRQNVFAFFNQNLQIFISSTIIAEAIISVSFGIHLILGLIIFIPAQLYVYDRLLHKSTLLESVKRVFILPTVNIGLCIRSIGVSYLILFLFSFIFIAIAFSLTSNFRISATILTAIIIIASGFVNIVIAFLYHSLYIKAKNDSKI